MSGAVNNETSRISRPRTYIGDVVGNSISAANGMSRDSRFMADIASLVLDACEWSKVWFGDECKELIEFAKVGRDWLAFGASFSFATGLFSTKTFVQFGIFLCKAFKYGRSFLSTLQKRNITQIFGCVDRLSVTGKVAGVVASVLCLYEAFWDIVHLNAMLREIENHQFNIITLDDQNQVQVARNISQDQEQNYADAGYAVRRQKIMQIAKEVASLFGAIVGIAAIYTGAAVVAGIVTLVASSTAIGFTMLKAFVEKYDNGLQRQESDVKKQLEYWARAGLAASVQPSAASAA